MIKCSTLEEIKSLMVIKNCCANTQECSYCRFADICEWMPESPSNWILKLEKGEDKELT